MKELLDICGKITLRVDDHCEVTSEKDRIDIVVKRKAQTGEELDSDNNFAIIYENKIHGAKDGTGYENAKGQLDKYVEAIKNKFDYKYTDIHVFYLPLRADKDPIPEDQKAIIGKVGDDNYKKITFETEILRWLENVTDGKTVALKHEGMRDNLNHYKNLITYLVNKDKESKMSTEIFEHIKKTEKEGGELPSLEAALRAQAAVNELVPCLQIYKSLKTVKAEFPKELQIGFEEKFPRPLGEAVGLKVSGVEVTLWFGYDLDENNWFFCCQHMDEKSIQCLEIFSTKYPWMGDGHFLYRFADDVLGAGFDFKTHDLSPTIAQMVAKKILEWRDLVIQNKI